MRSYIFTDRERAILLKLLNEGVRIEGFDMILYRMRNFKRLESDIELYHKVMERFKQSSSSPK